MAREAWTRLSAEVTDYRLGMLDAVARPARRNVWGWAYIGLGLSGVAALFLTPPAVTLFLPFAVYVWGGFELFFFAAAFCAFTGKFKLEQAYLWLGCAGIATYVLTLWQRILLEHDLTLTSAALGFTVLLGLMVATGVWLGQHVRREIRRKKIIAIAERE